MTASGEPPQPREPSDDAKRKAERIVIYGYLGLIAFLVVSGEVASILTDGRVHIEVATVGVLIGGLSGLLIAKALTR